MLCKNKLTNFRLDMYKYQGIIRYTYAIRKLCFVIFLLILYKIASIWHDMIRLEKFFICHLYPATNINIVTGYPAARIREGNIH